MVNQEVYFICASCPEAVAITGGQSPTLHHHDATLAGGASQMGSDIVDRQHHVTEVDRRQQAIEIVENIYTGELMHLHAELLARLTNFMIHVSILQVDECHPGDPKCRGKIGKSEAPVHSHLRISASPGNATDDVLAKKGIGCGNLSLSFRAGQQIGIWPPCDARGIDAEKMAEISHGRLGGKGPCDLSHGAHAIDKRNAGKRSRKGGMEAPVRRHCHPLL